eukprot:scaffold58465_cov24-Tisochrysis_lutea.AAC.2
MERAVSTTYHNVLECACKHCLPQYAANVHFAADARTLVVVLPALHAAMCAAGEHPYSKGALPGGAALPQASRRAFVASSIR